MVAPVCYETPKSQKWRQDAASAALTREWVVLGTDDPLEVRDLLLESNPLYFLGLSRKSVQADTLGAQDLWAATVEYGVSAVLDGLKPDELSFKIGSQSVHITNSLETIFRRRVEDATGSGTNLTVDATNPLRVTPDGYTPVPGDVGKEVSIADTIGWTPSVYDIVAVSGGKWTLSSAPAAVGTTGGQWSLGLLGGTTIGTAPDMQGAIGVTIDSVQGCDILVPKMEFSLSRQRAMVDFAYIRTLRNMVGKTNNATFFGFPKGTLLYLGCEPTSAMGTLDTGDKFLFWNLCHSFAQEEDKVNQRVGNITLPKKGGFEYVWARYNPVVSGAAPQLAMHPTAVYCERVYIAGNFELLEIGS